MSDSEVLTVMARDSHALRNAGLPYAQTIEARATVMRMIEERKQLVAALRNADEWIREIRVQHGLQATATIDQNRAALSLCKGDA
jgi:hypothetical protein